MTMKRRLKIAAVTLLLAMNSTNALSQSSAVGLWRTIDDQSGKPRVLVRINESNGELYGKIERLFREPGQDPNPKCEKCDDARKNQPLNGMVIINGMRRDGDEYRGGRILDPESGKVYKAKMTLLEGGKKLDVRGYIGLPALGRSQTWLREANDSSAAAPALTPSAATASSVAPTR